MPANSYAHSDRRWCAVGIEYGPALIHDGHRTNGYHCEGTFLTYCPCIKRLQSSKPSPAEPSFFRISGAVVEIGNGAALGRVILAHESTAIRRLRRPIVDLRRPGWHDVIRRCSARVLNCLQPNKKRRRGVMTSTSQQEVMEEQSRCLICMDRKEQPIILDCGHLYCRDCLRALCGLAAIMSKPQTSVMCAYVEVGDRNRCQGTLSLDQVQGLLSRAEFANLLRVLFEKHLRRNTEEYGHCSTPDCSFVFRRFRDPCDTSHLHTHIPKDLRALWTEPYIFCTKCRVATCRRCGHQHKGVSCAVYKQSNAAEHAEQAVFETWKAGAGAKDCPDCQMPILKGKGCNHVQCGICRSHICWKCTKAFNNDKECLDHLADSCGGIFSDDIVRQTRPAFLASESVDNEAVS